VPRAGASAGQCRTCRASPSAVVSEVFMGGSVGKGPQGRVRELTYTGCLAEGLCST
jgi:hypothetical protein